MRHAVAGGEREGELMPHSEAVRKLIAAAKIVKRLHPQLSDSYGFVRLELAVEAVEAEEKPQDMCKHCGKSIDWFLNMARSLEWKHSDGYYSCGGRSGWAETCAEPVQYKFRTVNSPVHQIGGSNGE
jgi:hypothetical protein